MAFNVNEIKAQLEFGGARPTLFQVQITNPATSAADLKAPFMMKASTMPESSLGFVEVPYFGRKIRVAGDRVFAPWSVTVVNDEDFLVRDAMEQWSNSINALQRNVRGTGSSSPSSYKSDALVSQFSKTGELVRQYKFVGVFPTTIAPIPLSWEATDTIEEFDVEFQYDYWEVSAGITGNAGGI
jgi:hypothetical protein